MHAELYPRGMFIIQKCFLILSVALAGVSSAQAQQPPSAPAQQVLSSQAQLTACLTQAREQIGPIITMEALRQYMADHPDCDRMPPVQSRPLAPRKMPVEIRNENGHYYPHVTINGMVVRMMVDTGASLVSLSAADARRVGIDPQSLQFTGVAHTANGTVRTAPITLREIAIEGMVLHNVRASCCVTGEALLGMSALERLNFTIGSGWMSMALKN
jgi:clan AA aspartic protease (TIGR02281 family)